MDFDAICIFVSALLVPTWSIVVTHYLISLCCVHYNWVVFSVADSRMQSTGCLWSSTALRTLQINYPLSSKRVSVPMHEPAHRLKMHFLHKRFQASFSACLILWHTLQQCADLQLSWPDLILFYHPTFINNFRTANIFYTKVKCDAMAASGCMHHILLIE